MIIYPTGGGVGLIGIYRALQQLRELGWIRGEMPRLVSVQSAGCAPIVRAVEQSAQVSEPWPQPHTIAFGITVPKPLGDFLILEAVYATGGTALAVGGSQRKLGPLTFWLSVSRMTRPMVNRALTSPHLW